MLFSPIAEDEAPLSGASFFFCGVDVPFTVVGVDEASVEVWSVCPGIEKGGDVVFRRDPFRCAFKAVVFERLVPERGRRLIPKYAD